MSLRYVAGPDAVHHARINAWQVFPGASITAKQLANNGVNVDANLCNFIQVHVFQKQFVLTRGRAEVQSHKAAVCRRTSFMRLFH